MNVARATWLAASSAAFGLAVSLLVAPGGPFESWFLYLVVLFVSGFVGNLRRFGLRTGLGLGLILAIGGMESALLLIGLSNSESMVEALFLSILATVVAFGLGAFVGLLPVCRRGWKPYAMGVLGFVSSGVVAGTVMGLVYVAARAIPFLSRALNALPPFVGPALFLAGVPLAFAGGTAVLAWAWNRSRAPSV